ncbi:MAG: hypothetical protein A2X56_06170 [Nitrospirae bacterium GWC2_57_13]|nr:MAG: hypothetical protein A2X56_06170 [Nitrospirae bacterium GWC2_57_13]OGW44294.1 MAG: hypothetical protein A2X57_02010 [Nitrospirae bacterium GWD2_57_8]HAR46748.1 hypothetical protein [Nitrospiraceae bacterium]HAS54291.1 hypothetical protein [Nitrospiraceae bacterium]
MTDKDDMSRRCALPKSRFFELKSCFERTDRVTLLLADRVSNGRDLTFQLAEGKPFIRPPMTGMVNHYD